MRGIDGKMMEKENGNVLVYILIAVALLASLTYAISRDSGGQQQNQLTTSRVKLLASDLIKHAVAAEQAVYMMNQFGVDYDEIRFDLPGTATYSTNTSQQLYHPNGGGLNPMNNIENYTDSLWANFLWLNWAWKNTTNVEWTSTAATDILYTKGGVKYEICKEVNRQLHGIDDVIVQDVATNIYLGHFNGIYATDTDLTAASCPNCEGLKLACIGQTSGSELRAFYNIIGSR